MDELSEIKHRLLAIEQSVHSLQRGAADEVRARERVADDESAARESSEKRVAADMEDVSGKLGTIVHALMGDIAKPDVPGLVQRTTDLRQQQQINTIALGELKAVIEGLKKSLEEQKRATDEYRASMPSPDDFKTLKSATEAQKSRMTYVMGWVGGVSAVLLILWKLAESAFALVSQK